MKRMLWFVLGILTVITSLPAMAGPLYLFDCGKKPCLYAVVNKGTGCPACGRRNFSLKYSLDPVVSPIDYGVLVSSRSPITVTKVTFSFVSPSGTKEVTETFNRSPSSQHIFLLDQETAKTYLVKGSQVEVRVETANGKDYRQIQLVSVKRQ